MTLEITAQVLTRIKTASHLLQSELLVHNRSRVLLLAVSYDFCGFLLSVFACFIDFNKGKE